MALKKSKITAIAMCVGIVLTTTLSMSVSANNLVQLDLKRISNDSVDVTLVTTDAYSDNVMVRKKSDNKYVILVPKVQSSGFSSSALTGMKDIISDVDVKTVNDTNGGYTKVTLITTKPLDIRTKTQKSTLASAEQNEYKTLIEQANAVRNTISKHEPTKQKTEVTVNKVAETKNVPKQSTKSVPQKEVKAHAPEIKLEEIKPQNEKRQEKKAHLQNLVEELKQEIPQENLAEQQDAVKQENLEDIKEAMPLATATQVKPSISQKVTQKFVRLAKAVKNKLPKPSVILLSLLSLFIVSKLLKSAQRTVAPAFIDQLVQEPSVPDIKNDIADNSELSWQEKYRLYLDKSATPVKRANNKGSYVFIKNRVDNVDKKRIELEKLFLEPESVLELQEEPEIVEVMNEDDFIHNEIKLRAFDNRKPSLKMTSRNKSRFKKYEVEIPLHEQKNIELGDSLLHTNPRSFKDANLKIADVDKNRLKPQDYVMSTPEEFFAILDREEALKKEVTPIVQPQQVAQSQSKSANSVKSATNPIAKMKKEVSTKGLIIKSGFDIDEKKGFYIVNNEGQNALVGKVNDEIFVLKKFSGNVTDPIQVRHDNANVYMVKAGKFKSLVEVKDDKMGVLIEL